MTTHPWKSALVTGASSGIGEAIARRLLADSATVVAVARRRDRLEALAAAHAGVEVLAADLTSAEGLAAVEARLTDDARPIDLLVNNAGFGTSGRFVDTEADRLDEEVGLNVVALTRLSRVALGPMVARGRGWLLNVSSLAGFQTGPNMAVYAATKAYVTSLTEALHEELRGTGVSATALCPGLTRTEFQQVSNSEGQTRKAPAFAWMSADDVAAMALDAMAHNRAIAIPGTVNKSMAMASSLAPRALVRRVSGMVMR